MVYIDFPDKNNLRTDDEGGWVNVHTVKTKAEAVAWIREHLGQCDDDGNVCLISLGYQEGKINE